MTPQKDPKIIAEQLCEYARTNLVADGAAFNEHSPLADAGIDSFALMELLLYCERTLGVRVPDSHLTCFNLSSVSALSRCVAQLASNGHTPAPQPPEK